MDSDQRNVLCLELTFLDPTLDDQEILENRNSTRTNGATVLEKQLFSSVQGTV